MRKKRVLLLSEGFGSGHTQAAYALAFGLRELNPNIQTRVIELGKFLNPVIGPLIMNAYRKTVSKQPKLVGKLYHRQYKKSMNRFTQLALHRIFYTHTLKVFDQLKPDLIVCTHPGPNAVVSRLKRLGLVDIPLYTLITDYDAHGTWTSSEVNKYLVSTPLVKRKLTDRGIPASRIEVTGIPVHPDFWHTHDKSEIQAKFGLKPIPTVLIMGGGWGIMYSDDILEYMTRWRDRIQLIYCVGNNDKARERMLADPAFQHPNIQVLGFTKEVSKLMDVSDLLITKPGGMTCTEGLSKGIPMLFYEPIPGQEEVNCEYFVEYGFGEMLTSTELVDKWFSMILEPYTSVQYRRTLLVKRNQQYNPMQCSRAVLQLMQ
ncbi:MGDG synthase family glycosyltransferase [Paenibacillus humicola]|uniref:MGDG synthase family glycosyltransferase n=1 Tax=Paenibacillus humicola TaxID=3110540 RepID=UPI00237B337A|nr:glycosyltransferase [Paenibacillus humicola]